MIGFSVKRITYVAALIVGSFVMSPALAHTDSLHRMASFTGGFVHPLSGLDHLLAMLSIGLWAVQQRSRAPVWVLPLVFPVMMVFGAVLGVFGLYVPGIENGIAASVALLGMLIAFAVGLPVWGSTIIASWFAMMHGYAHGVELPVEASFVLYGAGFVAATATLHFMGILLGFVVSEALSSKVLRIGGTGIAATGVCLLFV